MCEHSSVPGDYPKDLQRDPSLTMLLVMLQPRWTVQEEPRAAGAALGLHQASFPVVERSLLAQPLSPQG